MRPEIFCDASSCLGQPVSQASRQNGRTDGRLAALIAFNDGNKAIMSELVGGFGADDPETTGEGEKLFGLPERKAKLICGNE